VPAVSKKLTALMLGTLFDMPEEDAMKIPEWTEKIVSFPGIHGRYASDEEKWADLQEMYDYFEAIWQRKRHEEPKFDLISMLVHNPTTQNMTKADFHGNLRLLVVGGNDTTRNSMTSGVIQMKENPDQFAKLKAEPALIESMVSELIRWQSPLAHMRRTATQDVELRGKKIKKGDKVIMWYLSGNFDDEKIANADKFMVDRPNARQQLSFGFGLHLCLGNRVAELQLRVLWEELIKRFDDYEIVGEPVFSNHNFVRGFDQLMVRLPA
jgi:cytochrome P450